jgi:hypothetical protein
MHGFDLMYRMTNIHCLQVCLVVGPTLFDLCDSFSSMAVTQNVAIYVVYNTRDFIDCVREQCPHEKKT